MTQITFWDVLFRLLCATLCGGIIGIDRGKKNRPAGFRTYILVCMGATLTVVLGVYLSCMLAGPLWADALSAETVMKNTDVSRFGAQVINGIGFLGAGTIIITGRQQVKGMTTAAGLWASACMGLAIGAGFYSAALITCLLIVLTMAFFTKLESLILMRTRNVNYYVEFEHLDNLSEIAETVKSMNIRIFDVEITKAKQSENGRPSAIFSVLLPKKMSHTALLTALAEIESVRSIEEL